MDSAKVKRVAKNTILLKFVRSKSATLEDVTKDILNLADTSDLEAVVFRSYANMNTKNK